MVQMKDEGVIDENVWFNSLYPTWFRWKNLRFAMEKNRKGLYIPHGSDEREKFHIKRPDIDNSLYPTWFRWKTSCNRDKCHGYKTLYPTWFRWKQDLISCPLLLLLPLYPTWFRWKRKRIVSSQSNNFLYIPHGSDER